MRLISVRSFNVRGATLIATLILAGAAACAPPPPPPQEPAAADPPGPMPEAKAESMSEEPAPPAEAPPAEEKKKAFHDMDPGEKLNHMKTVVAPAMAKTFQEFDAKDFANFSCATCHGPGAKDGKFDMPTTALPPLDKKLMDKHPAATKFMMEKVVPEMAALLGEEPYDPAKGEGFGCMECHTEKK
jgi:mono/diheme cytochrome c family protein